MQFDHITSDTSQGACSEPAVEPCLVVRCGICRSDSLSNSMVKATSTWESGVDKGAEPCLGVRGGICRSDSLSNSMVNATSTWESRVDKGRPPERAPRLLEGSALAGAVIEGEASLGRPISRLASTLRSR